MFELRQDAVITAPAHLFPHSPSVLHGNVLYNNENSACHI